MLFETTAMEGNLDETYEQRSVHTIGARLSNPTLTLNLCAHHILQANDSQGYIGYGTGNFDGQVRERERE
jgi:hypothetical protein